MARPVALTPMRQAAARQMRRTATRLDADHPETTAGDHVRDAARVLEHGSIDGAKRHLDAAMEVLTPRSLYRHGITDDEGHATAKHHMHAVHRSRLAVQDIEEAKTRNQQIADALKATSATIEQTDAAAATAAKRPAPPSDTSGLDGGAGPSRPPAPTAPGAAPVRRPRPQIPAGKPAPPRPASAATRLATELVGPKGYVHGWIRVSGTTFGAGLEPGSFEHARAIDDLAERAGAGTGDPGTRSPTMQTALHNVARAVIARDIPTARAHMQSAAWANRREAHGLWTRDLSELSAQLGRVPSQATGWRQHEVNPLSPRGQHPGRYVSAATHPPANPTAGATVVAYATELSARTAMLERTPAPRGRPGGPGLYDVKGMGHTAYFQQVVKALIEKRGMPKDRAYRIAWGALRKWRRGGGGVHPEVRAAATGALAGEAARGAVARASHGHAASPWEMADLLIDLAAGQSDPLAIELGVLAWLHERRDRKGRWASEGGETAPSPIAALPKVPASAYAPLAPPAHPRPGKLKVTVPPAVYQPPPGPVNPKVMRQPEQSPEEVAHQQLINSTHIAVASATASVRAENVKAMRDMEVRHQADMDRLLGIVRDSHKEYHGKGTREEKSKANQKLAVEGGVVLASATIGAVEARLGVPGLAALASAAAPQAVQVLTEWRRGL